MKSPKCREIISLVLLVYAKCLKNAIYDFFIFALSIPTGKPSLVKPTLNKIDVEALKRDLKKFEELHPLGVSRAWAQWLQEIEKRLEIPDHWEWPLKILEGCSKVQRPVIEAFTIPDNLQAMRGRETVETQQVCFIVYGK